MVLHVDNGWLIKKGYWVGKSTRSYVDQHRSSQGGVSFCWMCAGQCWREVPRIPIMGVHSHPDVLGWHSMLICPASGTENSISVWQDRLWNLSLSDQVALPVMGTKGNTNKGKSSAKALFEARKGSGLTSIGTKHSWGLTQLDLQPKKEEWKHKQEMPVPFQYKKPSFMQLKQNFLKSASLEMTTLFCYLRTIGSVRIYKAMHVKTLFPH